MRLRICVFSNDDNGNDNNIDNENENDIGNDNDDNNHNNKTALLNISLSSYH